MNTASIIFFIIGIVSIITVIVSLFVVLKTLKNQKSKEDGSSLLLLQNQIQELSRAIDTRLHESSRFMQTQYSDSQKIIREVTEKLTKLDETNKQVVNFADQLQSLQDILKNPKQRGILGEYFLEETLKNVLPPNAYKMQYKFEDGEIVDAAVFVKDKVIPVDAKFSLENYERILNENDPVAREALEKEFKNDLKKRIDETSKYVRPSEGTMEFAFMFIPSEAIYYDLLVNKVGAVKVNTRDMIEYAFKEKKVIIVSPTNFLAYLQTVLQGLRALQIEESAKEIRKRVEELGKHMGAYDQFMQSLGKSLEGAVSNYNKASKELGKIDKDVVRIAGTTTGVEPIALVPPSHDEE